MPPLNHDQGYKIHTVWDLVIFNYLLFIALQEADAGVDKDHWVSLH